MSRSSLSNHEEWTNFDKSMESLLGVARNVKRTGAPSSSSSSSVEKFQSDKTPLECHQDQESREQLPQLGSFSCAACGLHKDSYKEISHHIQEAHVGDDMELVLASILLPEDAALLREYQCGVKSCGFKMMGGTDQELRNHISSSHGDFYVNICSGRNMVRMCRICEGKFGSDSLLTEHLDQWHPRDMFATKMEEHEDCDEDSNKQAEPIKLEPQEPRKLEEKTFQVPKQESSQTVRMSLAHMDLERQSRKRKLSESVKERLTMIAHSSSKVMKIRDTNENLLEEHDLKFKLQSIRAEKTQVKKYYCEACCRSTRDWSFHQHSSEHVHNDREHHCMFCPRRFWPPELKQHVEEEHRNCSFTCNVVSSCKVRLMQVSFIHSFIILSNSFLQLLLLHRTVFFLLCLKKFLNPIKLISVCCSWTS